MNIFKIMASVIAVTLLAGVITPQDAEARDGKGRQARSNGMMRLGGVPRETADRPRSRNGVTTGRAATVGGQILDGLSVREFLIQREHGGPG